jgi:hypothetical protein
MSPKSLAAEEGFAVIVKALGDKPGVRRPDEPSASAHRFGASALRVHGRIFAMITSGRLVLKLPAQRVAELVGSGDGSRFDAGRGQQMKEWISLEPTQQAGWLALASEALEFVASKR